MSDVFLRMSDLRPLGPLVLWCKIKYIGLDVQWLVDLCHVYS